MENKASVVLKAPLDEPKGSVTFGKTEYSSEKPSPLDFDAFVPWVCVAWQSPVLVTVTRVQQEDDAKGKENDRRVATKSAKNKENDPNSSKKSTKSTSNTTQVTSKSASPEDSNTIPIKSIYDARGRLVEISIIGSHIEIPRKAIQAISLCVCFHSSLTKITIRKGGLNSVIIYEIAKLLPVSNLTDICMDDSCVREENYYILLDQISQLKTLSLNRCQISDEACAKIAARLDFGCSGCSLLTLELGSNLITNVGAKALGDALRRNRELLHLNLSGNTITDQGAFAILKHLTEFPLTYDEILEARRRKLKFLENRMAIYDRCLKEVLQIQRSEVEETSGSAINKLSRKMQKKPKKPVSPKENNEYSSCNIAENMAESMAAKIVGEFSDPFNVVAREKYCYDIGNMFLCSLNLAYNSLTYLSIKKLFEIIRYQRRTVKPGKATGLLRVLLYGNYISESYIDFLKVEMRLDCTASKNTSPANLQKKRRSTLK